MSVEDTGQCLGERRAYAGRPYETGCDDELLVASRSRALHGRSLSEGSAEGELLVLEAPLSFWGGMDPGSGRIVDPHHPQRGTVLSGKIVAMPAGKGSSSSSSVLAEAIRRGTAPAGIVLWQPDGIVALGAIVAAELYGRQCPIVCLVEQDYAQLRSGIPARIAGSEEGATIELCS